MTRAELAAPGPVFASVRVEVRALLGLETPDDVAWERGGGTPSGRVTRFVREVMERAAMLERAQEIYAASIFLVLDQWIKALSKSLGIDEHQREFGEQIGRARLALLIWATANNFRHYGEWAEPNKLAKVNIKILDAAGVHNVQDSIVSPQVLQVIQVRTYEELEAKVEGIGKDMLARAFG